MISRNYKTEVQLQQISRDKWEIQSSMGSLGVLEGFTTQLEAEKYVYTMMQQKFPETEIAFVKRLPHNRNPHTNDLMRAATPKKKLHAAGCIGIAREHIKE